MYLLVDLVNEYREKINSYKELKERIIEIIEEDVLDNCRDENIVKNGVKFLANIANDKPNEVKKAFEYYNYKIIDLLQLQRDLEDVKECFKNNWFVGDFDKVLGIINKEVNRNE